MGDLGPGDMRTWGLGEDLGQGRVFWVWGDLSTGGGEIWGLDQGEDLRPQG